MMRILSVDVITGAIGGARVAGVAVQMATTGPSLVSIDTVSGPCVVVMRILGA